MFKNISDDTSAAYPEGQRQHNPVRDRALARLWELADLSPEATRGSIAGQIKAMTMIVAIEGLIPDRRHSQTPTQPAAPPPKPDIYVSKWLRKQKELEAEGMDPADIVAAATEALNQEPPPDPTPSQRNELSSRPERTRISYHAAPSHEDGCGSPQREPHALSQRDKTQQEIRGSEVEGPAVPEQNQTSPSGSWVPDAATGSIFEPITDPNDPRQPLWMRMKKRRRR
jgi:hypothetical protein